MFSDLWITVLSSSSTWTEIAYEKNNGDAETPYWIFARDVDAVKAGEIAGLFDQLGGCARDSFDVDVAVKAVTIT